MPTLFAANESIVLVNGTAVEGVRAVEYRRNQARESIYAIGSAERVGLVSGPLAVEGQLTVASTSPQLDQVPGDTAFQITAKLRHGDTSMTVAFDECFLVEKSFGLGVGGHGEAIYRFTATRVREEIG